MEQVLIDAITPIFSTVEFFQLRDVGNNACVACIGLADGMSSGDVCRCVGTSFDHFDESFPIVQDACPADVHTHVISMFIHMLIACFYMPTVE